MAKLKKVRFSMKIRQAVALLIVSIATLFPYAVLAQYVQQGPKLVGNDAVGASRLGISVALSADGNTAIVGGDIADVDRGAAWIWTRAGGRWSQSAKLSDSSNSGVLQGAYVAISADGTTAAVGGAYGTTIWAASNGVWSQQSSRLTGSDPSQQRAGSVALSADGNTVIVGRPEDNAYVGAALVWTRSGGVWTKQGPALVGSGNIYNSQQGYSVSLSADGNTAIVGGPYDDEDPYSYSGAATGAVWVWTRSAGVWTQQGPKLVGTSATIQGFQGYSVSLSADGKTAIVGGPESVIGSAKGGAACVWTREGTSWQQQGPSLVAPAGAFQGFSVALSGDGNIAMVGSPSSNSAWVWTRTNAVWTLQASKLLGTDEAPFYFGTLTSYPFIGARQGTSVALSADGNTAIVGGPADDPYGFIYENEVIDGTSASGSGAAWIWIRSGNSWSQQGPKLAVASPGRARQGYAVALSADGNTAVVGGIHDHGNSGATWVWSRVGAAWTQSAKLVGTGASGFDSYQGGAVAISADGDTVIVGANADNEGAGAIWVFTRTGGVWTQQGPKLVGSGAAGAANQGFSVALSADGNTAIAGGFSDGSTATLCCYGPNGDGAAWIWTRSGGVWSQQGPKLVGSGGTSGYVSGVGQGYSVALSADGNTALVGGHGDAATWVWTRSGGVWSQQGAKLPGGGVSVALSADGNHALLDGGFVWTRRNGLWNAEAKLGTKAYFVAFSGDGNIAVIGNTSDDNQAGAVYVWARSAGVWTRRSKLMMSDRVASGQQGLSAAISADGGTIIVGSPYDDGSTGAAWVFAGMPDAPPPPPRQHAVRR